jgi:hypothetical protein
MESSPLYKLWLNDVGRWLVYMDINDVMGDRDTAVADSALAESVICEKEKGDLIYLVKRYASIRRKFGMPPSDIWLVTVAPGNHYELGRSRLTEKDGVW